MSTLPDAAPAPAWHAYRVPVFRGLFDTNIETGADYQTKDIAFFFKMKPWKGPKVNGPAFVPSIHHDYDAREHAVQREKGSFVALTGDIDSGDHPQNAVVEAVQAFAGDSAWLVYSSPHARPSDMRWRIILPLAEPIPFDTWHDGQCAFFAFMESRGLAMDHALARAAQPVFLPNVPVEHSKSGTKLRGEDGTPLYFTSATSGADKPGLALDTGPASEGIAALRRKRMDDDAGRERIRKEAEQRRAASPRGDGASLMDDFNAVNSVASMLEMCGYEQSPRNAEDWRSPHQTGETYATRIIGSKFVSLSQSDASAGVGTTCKSGCFGDAYDLFVHYKHGGDHKAAYRALGQERRDANVVYLPQAEPPEWMQGVPLPDEAPEWMDMGEDALIDSEMLTPDLLAVFSPADWTGIPPNAREWRWDSFVPDFQATLLTGAGAAGKSLATQQMATCIALGLPFLGVPTKQCPALYITCEDDLEELHRRQDAICNSLGVPLELTRDKLFLISLQGEVENELARFDNEGKMTIAPRYTQIEQTCLTLGIRHVMIDNTAHTFAGNENDRHQVAAFVNLNNRLAKAIGGSVIMVGHPNKAGDSYSGSTAWENQVRSRLYLEIPKSGDVDDGTPIDPDMRVLRNEKANYSQRGSEVTFFWLKGAFVTEEQMPKAGGDTRDSARAGYENGIFLALLDKLTEQRRNVSHSPNAGVYAPKVMAAMPGAKGLSRGTLARAMERLFTIDEIAAGQSLWEAKNRHPVIGLARKKP